MTDDPIDKAIAAASAPGDTVQMAQVQLNVPPSGRPIVIAVPADITYEEAFHAMGALLQIIVNVRAQHPKSKIVLPNGHSTLQ